MTAMTIRIAPADWRSFAQVMGPNGGCGGCWCMLWRLDKRAMEAGKGEGNRRAMKALFDSGRGPGLIALDGDAPVGWIQVDERGAFPRLERSRVLKPVDGQPVWSVSCFLVVRNRRRQGIAGMLLDAACDRARRGGGTVIEGYPIDPRSGAYPPVYAWTGFLATFARAGFREVARRSPTRPIMRKTL